MSGTLDIELEGRPLDRIEADLAVAGLFSDDRPLRGGAGRVDWRLCGLISELMCAGQLRGERGEAVLLPSSGRLRAPRILLLGLGERSGFGVACSREVMRDAVSRGLALGVRRLAVAPLGIEPDDFPRHAQAVLSGALEAASEGSLRVELRLAIRGSQSEGALRALEVATQATESGQVRLRRIRSIAGAPVAPRGRRATS